MNKITNDLHRFKTTGRTRGIDGKVIKVSKEEKAKHIHPRRKRFKAEDGGEG